MTKVKKPKKHIKTIAEINSETSDLIHCTICGTMHTDVKKCVSCGNKDSQRPNIVVGTTVYMTVKGVRAHD